MAAKLSSTELDEILAIQLTVAWAGEAAGDPKRLGWWKSDLVDPEGGGDLFVRLIPKTAAWASLGLVRKAAIRVDEIAREKLAHGDRVWTLFHFGFAVDEQLRDRLAWHRNHQNVPSKCLGARYWVGSDWSKAAFESVLTGLGRAKVHRGDGSKMRLDKGVPVRTAPPFRRGFETMSKQYVLDRIARDFAAQVVESPAHGSDWV